MRASRGGMDLDAGFRYNDSWWWARESVTRARGVSKNSWMWMGEYGENPFTRDGAAHLALRYGSQCLDQLKPPFDAVSLFNLVQP
jgi:hypothetical protein